MVTVAGLTTIEGFAPEELKSLAVQMHDEKKQEAQVEGEEQNPGMLSGFLDSMGKALNNPFRLASWATPLAGQFGTVAAIAGNVSSTGFEAHADLCDRCNNLQDLVDKYPRLGLGSTAEEAMATLSAFPGIKDALDTSGQTYVRGGAQAATALFTGGSSLFLQLPAAFGTDYAVNALAGFNDTSQQQVLDWLEWIGKNPRINVQEALTKVDNGLLVGDLDDPPPSRPDTVTMNPGGDNLGYAQLGAVPSQALPKIPGRMPVRSC